MLNTLLLASQLALGAEPDSPTAQGFINQYDNNGDGRITPADEKGHREVLLATIDSNTMVDLAVCQRDISCRIQALLQAGQRRRRMKQALRADYLTDIEPYDLNGDGRVTSKDTPTMKQEF